MKKVTDILCTKEDIQKLRSSLEEKTADALAEVIKSRRKVQEMAHLKYLD